MIKKYKLFKESSDTINLDSEFYEFMNTLWECQKYYTDLDMDQFSSSYSRTAQNGVKDSHGNQFDPDEDCALVFEYMRKNGWPDERIENLFLKMPNINLKVYDSNTCTCAPIDYFLYELTDESYPLQGYVWDIKADLSDEDLSEDDIFIKFGYGWHKTKYGRICIEQNFGTLEKFFNYTMNSSIDILTDAIVEEKVGESNESKEKIRNCIMVIDKSHNELYIDSQDMKKICESSLQDSQDEDNWRINQAIQTQSEFDYDIVNICKATLSAPVRISSPGNIKVLFK